jgi:hypothetical protein
MNVTITDRHFTLRRRYSYTVHRQDSAEAAVISMPLEMAVAVSQIS